VPHPSEYYKLSQAFLARLKANEREADEVFELETGTAWDPLALSAEDVAGTVKQFYHYSVEKTPEPQPEADTYTAFIKDPDSRLVELIYHAH
jgi:hypothetical protein